MLSKKEIKDIQSLRYKKQRDEAGIFLAEGPKVVKELAEALPGGVEKIYALAPWAEAHAHLNLPIEVISTIELEKISGLQTPNLVAGIFNMLDSVEPIVSSTDFCLYLDAIQDPGNLGTIIRIADWFGIKNIVYAEGTADAYNPKVIQASMASIARVNLFMDDQGQWIKKQKGPIYAATLHGKPIASFEKNKGAILLIGNESKGLSAELLKLATEEITIPRRGNAESLNAAVATGIILSHLVN